MQILKHIHFLKHMAGWRIDGRAIIIWLGALAISGVFYKLDQQFGCALFQRGGAVIVIYAILVGTASMRARSAYGDELNAIQSEQIEIAELMYAEDHAPTPTERKQASRSIERHLQDLDDRLERMSENGQKFQDLRFAEGPILILGTLLWGFGDLVFQTAGCLLV